MGMKKVKIENKVKNQMTRNEKLFYELYDELYDEDRLILFTTYFNIYDKFIFKKDIINYVLMKYPENEIYAAMKKIDEIQSEGIDIKTFIPKKYCPKCKKVMDSYGIICPDCGTILIEDEKKIKELQAKDKAYEEYLEKEYNRHLQNAYHNMIQGSYRIKIRTRKPKTEPGVPIPAKYKECRVLFDKEKMILNIDGTSTKLYYDEVCELEYSEQEVNELVTLIFHNGTVLTFKLKSGWFASDNEKKARFDAFIKTFIEQGKNLPL